MSWTSGLPPAAAERIARGQGTRVAGSLFSAPAAAAARIAGLEPVGEAMGLVVQQIGYAWFGCGGASSPYRAGPWATAGYSAPVITSGTPDGRLGAAGWADRVRALYTGWMTAMARLVAEAEGLGAHGVIGIRLERVPIDRGVDEFRALGTAVRWTGVAPQAGGVPGQVFASELGAEDVAKGLLAGWVPRGVAIGLSIAVRHDDWAIRQQTGSWRNQEVDGLRRLLEAARADARTQLYHRARRFGAEQVVVSSMTADLAGTRCPSSGGDGRDHIASATFVGTALARDPAVAERPPARPGTLTVLPLTGRGRERR